MKNNACVLIICPLKSIANDRIKEALNGLIGWLVNRLLNEVVAKTGRGSGSLRKGHISLFFEIKTISDWSFFRLEFLWGI